MEETGKDIPEIGLRGERVNFDPKYMIKPKPAPSDGFMSIPDGIEYQLPFE